jgi:hypothetical protein
MYEGLYDTRKGLSEQDKRAIGYMTACLLLPWNRWVHRRVDRLEFCDEDAARRRVSIDFTLPFWFHEARQTPKRRPKRQLVPLLFLRKGVLVNFSLWTETNASLPLLNHAQNAQVAEATLLALATAVLKTPVPPAIRCDIRDLVRQPPDQANATCFHLLNQNEPDPAAAARALLGGHAIFANTAQVFVENFLALSMLDIRRHERRIVHLAYEESVLDVPRSGRWAQAKQLRRLAFGRSRITAFDVPAVGDTDSYHVEIEAPDDLQISARERYHRTASGVPPEPAVITGGYKRAHVYFRQAEPGSLASVGVRLLPRSSTIIRSAFFVGLLAVVALLIVTVRIGSIQHDKEGAVTAATLLLATIGLGGLFLIREAASLMSTGLLLPIRVVGVSPVVWAFLASVVIVGHLSLGLTRALLIAASALTAMSTTALGLTWWRTGSAARK